MLTVSDRLRYEGDLSHPGYLPEGRGTLTDRKHSMHYEGEFMKGKMHGRGVMKRDGSKYEGEFKENKMHGQG